MASDNVGGAYRATEHLIILGHRRIAFVYSHHGGLVTTSVRDRHEGYHKALTAYGVSYDESLVFQLPFPSKDDTRNPYEELLRRPDHPTAIFTTVDVEAVAFLRHAQALGLRIPEDVALIGFDNLRLTSQLHPPLTTVAQSCREIGMRAANLLINRIEGQSSPPQHIELPTNLIIRESCGARLHVKNLPADVNAGPRE